MVLSHNTRSIFIHIQKTAGSSIESALRAKDPDASSVSDDGRRHMSAREAMPLVPASIWEGYFKFAFVRNPWERLVSWYQMCMESPTPNRFASYVRANAPTFSDFVLRAVTGMGLRTTVNQVEYVTDEKGALMVDFVGRYENLAQDYALVSRRLDLDALPRVNVSTHGDYRDYFSAETRDVVARRFARDIAYFGYAF